VQAIITHFVRPAQETKGALCRAWWSEVIWKFIVGKACCEAGGQVVVPACDPVAQVCDASLIKPVFSKVFVGEDADSGEMVLNCLQVEVRIMTAGKVLKIGIGEGPGDCVEIDDVTDHEPVVPGARLQADGVFKRHCPTLAAGVT
jgi:hypothetical protein